MEAHLGIELFLKHLIKDGLNIDDIVCSFFFFLFSTSLHILSLMSLGTIHPCLIQSRKRKRTEKKQVRFDIDHIVIVDTYSPLDYDRGSIFSNTAIQYKLNPTILNSNHHNSIPLEIPNSPSSSDEETNNPVKETLGQKKRKRPKLSVDTSICAGPLFLTRLTTHHKTKDDVNTNNDYLIPISALPV